MKALVWKEIEGGLGTVAPELLGDLSENEISQIVLDASIEVHRGMGGPGLLESAYEEALVFELQQRGLRVERQVVYELAYKGHPLASTLRVDLVVHGKVLVECKAAAQHHDIFLAQVLTYLRITGLRLGLLVNFGMVRIKDGFHRVANGL